MKKTLLAYLFVAGIVLSGNAQWKTLYEAGFGTTVSLRYDCGSQFTFSQGGGVNESTISFNVVDNQNRIGMYAYISPFNSETELVAGIYKHLPALEQYASLRVYLDMDLPDSVGTVYYSKLMDSTFNDPLTGTPSWTDFASDSTSSWIYFSNFEAKNTIYIYTVMNLSPASIQYNYLRIEADTTKMLPAPGLSQADFKVFSSGKSLYVQPSQLDSDYRIQLFDLSGKCVYQEQKSGQQQLPLEVAGGIYMVVITQDKMSYQNKVYFE